MATEKDKTIAKLYDDFLNDGGIATPEELYSKIWEAARADAIEECAKFVDDYDDIETYGGYYRNDDARGTLRKCAEELRSLSRKQEGKI